MAIWYRTGSTYRFNVESRLGIGLRATRMDVKLIQFLLTAVTRFAKERRVMRESFALAQDGIFGGNTLRALIAYQRVGTSTVPDGVVSPMRNNAQSWDEPHVWTISALQSVYTQSKLRTADFPSFMVTETVKCIPYDDEVDGELRNHLAGVLAQQSV